MAGVTLNKFLRKRKKNVQAKYFHLLPFSTFKFWRKKKKNVLAKYFHLLPGSRKSFLPSNFEEKKRRKMPKLNIFTCFPVPQSLVYLQISIRIANSCKRWRWIFKGLSHRMREGRIFLTSSLPSCMVYPNTLTLPQFVEYAWGLSK
jgi:hypothetical protein